MPALVSSLIPGRLALDSEGGSLSKSDLVALWDVVSTIPDPRGWLGIRYPLATILTLALAATVAGAGTIEQFAAWSADLPSFARGCCAGPPDPQPGQVVGFAAGMAWEPVAGFRAGRAGTAYTFAIWVWVSTRRLDSARTRELASAEACPCDRHTLHPADVRAS